MYLTKQDFEIAIAASPGNNLIRYQYSDFLRESSDPIDNALGEFMYCQLEIHMMEYKNTNFTARNRPAYERMTARYRELQAKYCEQWLKDFPLDIFEPKGWPTDYLLEDVRLVRNNPSFSLFTFVNDIHIPSPFDDIKIPYAEYQRGCIWKVGCTYYEYVIKQVELKNYPLQEVEIFFSSNTEFEARAVLRFSTKRNIRFLFRTPDNPEIQHVFTR